MRSNAAALVALFQDALSAVYPESCPLCGAHDLGDGAGCADHRLRVALDGPRCGRCAALLPLAIPHGSACAPCRLDAPSFARTACLLDYARDPAAREWILALKHRSRPDLAEPLGRMLGARLLLEDAALEGQRLLVPVPLHPTRALERGYDQARLLAEAASRVARVRVVRALSRVKRTPPQGSAATVSRRANVDGAFAPARFRLRARAAVRGAEVWIVDDVLTSGATASACARELKRLGAARVNVLALARA